MTFNKNDDELIRVILRPVRGCATDSQYCDAYDRLATALTTIRQEARAAAFRDAAQKLRDRGEDWRLQAERWQQNAQNAGMDIIREQDYTDRDVCLSKMSAAMTLAIELDEAAANSVKDSEGEGAR